MKITIEISDELLTNAKKYAAKYRITIHALIENGLRHELGVPNIRWITVDGGLPRGTKVADRAKMTAHLMNDDL